jgi:hypothetical protein
MRSDLQLLPIGVGLNAAIEIRGAGPHLDLQRSDEE